MSQQLSRWLMASIVTTFCVLLLCGVSRQDNVAAQEPKGKAAGDVAVTPSRVASVTVYPASAMVTREAEVAAGKGVVEITINPLPTSAVLSSLHAEAEGNLRVLSTRFRSRPVVQDHSAEIAKLQDEVAQLALAREKIEADVKANQENLKTLTKMEGFMGVTTIQAAEKGALNAESAIALAKYVKDTRLATMREQVQLEQQVKANQVKAAALQGKITELAAGTTRLERDAVVVVDRGNVGAGGKVRLNYVVEQ